LAYLLDRQSHTLPVDFASLSTYTDVSPILGTEIDKVHQLESRTRDLLQENERFASCVEIVEFCEMNLS